MTLPSVFLWGSLVTTAVLCSDCALTPIEVKSEVSNPAEVGKHSVAVIPDPYTDDLTAANRLADLVRKEMAQRGFRLSQSENTAELVIIPHLTSPTSGDSSAHPTNPVPRINLISANFGEPGMMQNSGPLGELPLLENRPALPQDQIQLKIMAVQPNDWRNALNVDQLKVPLVWQISVFAPTDFSTKRKEMTAGLVEAAGPRFAQLAASAQQIDPPFGLHWTEEPKEIAKLLDRARARIVDKTIVQRRERWTIEGLNQPALQRTIAYFGSKKNLVEVELQYQHPDWGLVAYENFLDSARQRLEARYGPATVLAKDRKPEGGVLQTTVGYQWQHPPSSILLFFFSVEYNNKVYRSLSVHYRAG